MVRGIYQTSEAGENAQAAVKFGLTLAAVLALIAGVFWSINFVGDKICNMPGYWNGDIKTYTAHARGALSSAGYSYRGISDKGDCPKGGYCGLSSVKIRRFIVKDFRAPDGSTAKRAEVFLKFDGGWNSYTSMPHTSVEHWSSL